MFDSNPVRSFGVRVLRPIVCFAAGSVLLACSSSTPTTVDQGAGGVQPGAGGTAGAAGGAPGSGGSTQAGGSGGAAGSGGTMGGAAGAGGSAGTGGAAGAGGTPGAGGSAGAGGSTTPNDAGTDALVGDGGYDPGKFYWSVATADTMIKKFPNGVNDSYYTPSTWSWECGYFMWAVEKVWRATGQKKYYDYIKNYIDGKIGANGTGVGLSMLGGLDQHLLGYSLTMLYEQTKEAKYKTAADFLRNDLKTSYPRTTEGGFWHSRDRAGQMWIDGGFMGEMFLARYGKTFADVTAFDEVKKQTDILANHLQIAAGGTMFRHAWAQNPAGIGWANPTTGVSSEVWSEGQGWHAILFADVFDWLPSTHPGYATIAAQRDKLAAGLKANADPNTGMWCQVVDKCTQAGNWNESSGTGMYIYFLQKSINRGFIAAADYQAVVTKAYAGLKTKVTNNNGTIRVIDISSIGVTNTYQDYINSQKSVDMPTGFTSFMISSLILELPATL